MSSSVPRLFEQFQPASYILKIHPDTSSMTFSGTVQIHGKKLGRPSQRLTFHQKDLNITSAKVVKHERGENKELIIDRINKQKSFDEVRLHATEMIYPGEYTVTLEFSGNITKPMHGLYPCFFEHNGVEKVLLATQFESHHAREVFPCIDEPEAKATFDLTLVTPKDLITLGNTPISKEKALDNNLKETSFETSPLMSSYLLAFVIGDIHCVESKTKDGIEMRTWGTLAQPKEFLQYANDEAVKTLDYFTEYFQTPFPLKKCDQIALPDFESGAMENWGLITYREIALLADPNNRSQSSEQYISMVVAHELSHQWFGNLVTMKWWDDLWLNESFASLMEHIALDALHPDWFQWETYTSSDVIASSSRDVFKDVQSVQVKVNHPDEISTLFDPAIVYAKGGRLLKMLREYIGDDAFRNGLKSYFKKHAYKNTVGDDLWEEFSKASGKDLKAFMHPWLSQSGMPVIDVNKTADIITLHQERFVLDSNHDKSLWPIPLLADTELETDLLTDRQNEISYTSDKPVIFNKNGSAHVLVNYKDTASKNYVAESFVSLKLEPSSRINVLNDLHLLARRGDASLTDSLAIISKSAAEPREAVWNIMARSIGTALNLTQGDDEIEKLIKQFRASLAANWYKKLGWEDKPNDSPNDKALRQTIVSLMVASEDDEALKGAIDRYKSASLVADLPAEQRAIIAGAAVKSNNADIDALIKEYKQTSNPDVQLSICAALTNTQDEKTAAYILESALGEDGFVRPQDIFRWYAYFMRNHHTRRLAWEWLKTSWDHLEESFGDSKSFDYFVIYSAAPITTKDYQSEFIEFFEPKTKVISLRRNIMVAISEIEARVAWRDREEPRLRNFFTKNLNAQ